MSDDFGELDETVVRRIKKARSEKITAATELTDLIKTVTGKEYPTLVTAIIDKIYR